MCYSAHNHVLYHVGSANLKGDIFVIFGHRYLQILLSFLYCASPETLDTLRHGDAVAVRISFGF